jgi:hypothetical protein
MVRPRRRRDARHRMFWRGIRVDADEPHTAASVHTNDTIHAE